MINLFSEKSLTDLWSDEHVILPGELSKIYEDYLLKIGTYKEALSVSPSDKELIGGSAEQATIAHFTHRFASSAIRIEYLTLNPKKQFNEIQSNLLKSLSDGKIALLDIPCGSGASIISLLCTLLALRKKRALVSLPLELKITAGDISSKAIEIYDELLEQIRPLVAEQGIRLSWKPQL